MAAWQLIERARVLVAGGGGFIGANLITRLLPEAAYVRATLHEGPAVVEHGSLEYARADLTRAEDCRRVVAGIDVVFMCAAQTSGAAVIAQSPLSHVTPNVVMNALMLDSAHRAGVRKFVFISSSVAYPPSGDRPVREEEMFTGDPEEVYYSAGWMKRYAEILCKTYAQKIEDSMPVLVVRPSNVYGPYDKFDVRTSHVTAALIRRVVERQNPVVVWGTGTDVRDVIYIDDFLDGVMLAVERPAAYLAVNIGAGEGWSVYTILQALLEADGFTEAKVRFDPLKPRTAATRLVDVSMAREVLGFGCKTSLGKGLRLTADWYRANRATWGR